jgi:hypothetical protein
MTTTKPHDMWVAWVGLVGGLLGSMAMNEARAFEHGYPGVGHMLTSLLAPGAFFIGIEMVARYRHISPLACTVALGFIVIPAAAVSYWMIWAYLTQLGWGYAAFAGPLLVDGVMAMSTVVLTATRVRKVRRVDKPAAAAVRQVDKPSDIAPIVSAAKPAAWDRALAAQLLIENKMKHAEIATRVGVSTKTIQRYAADLKASRS